MGEDPREIREQIVATRERMGDTADALAYFADILLAFFLAWLLAFIISPIVTRIAAAIPGLPRVLATVIV